MPLLGKVVQSKNRRNRADWYARAAVDALDGINKELVDLFKARAAVGVLRVLLGMDAVNWAGIHTSRIFGPYTGFSNYVRHDVDAPSVVSPELGSTHLLRVLRWSRSLLKHLSIPDSPFPCVARQLEVLRQFKGVHGTGILTEATEHAAREVVGKRRQVFAASLLVSHACYHDQIFRAGQRAQIAGDAESFISVRIDVESWRAPIAFCYSGPLSRILLGVDVLWILIPECDPQPLKQIYQ
jgi:hypothetical protein